MTTTKTKVSKEELVAVRTFVSGAIVGMITVTGMPSCVPCHASASAWFPALAAITPLLRSSCRGGRESGEVETKRTEKQEASRRQGREQGGSRRACLLTGASSSYSQGWAEFSPSQAGLLEPNHGILPTTWRCIPKCRKCQRAPRKYLILSQNDSYTPHILEFTYGSNPRYILF